MEWVKQAQMHMVHSQLFNIKVVYNLTSKYDLRMIA